jgi:HSP90 family molecular chaperone
LPLIGLFGMGIYSCYIVLKLDEEYESRKEADKMKNEGNNY